jgi:hypothetical protein
MIELRSESAVREQGEQLRAGYSGCPTCGRTLRLIAPLDDRIHPVTREARPLLLVCELRERAIAPRLYPGEGDGASAWWPRCDWARLVGWFARG